VLDELQSRAVLESVKNGLFILSGGPGTGKTTTINTMIKYFEQQGLDILLGAPTGRAAKRMTEATGFEAKTIHRLLEVGAGAEGTGMFARNDENPLEADLIIIDEMSMVDLSLMHALLKAVPVGTHLVLAGDKDQLPSVGPGCVLRDMIASEAFPVIRLDHIYRQENGSGVIALAHDINRGELQEKYSQDIGFYECRRQDIRNGVIELVRNAVEKGYSLDDVQVLSPMYNGAAGIDVLNNALQEVFNPPEKDRREIRIGYTTFREGDKILQLKNQPDDNVFNGDIGVIAEIIDASESVDRKTVIVADFQGNFVEYTNENWENITLAYCISVHKAQGSEYPIVIMPFTYQMGRMLQRRLIYTGVTRARKALILLGELGALRRGIETLEFHPRQTSLTQRLTQYDSSPEDILFG
jgi:exodeoxyribonuclease V alpha subunit